MKNQKTIISVILALLVLAVVGYNVVKIYKPDLIKSDVTAQDSISGNVTPEESAIIENALARNGSDVADVTINDVKDGKYVGVVEVGASGFNSFVIQVDANKNWKLIRKEFGKSLAIEGFATKEDILRGLKEYIATIFNTGVNGKNIHFVISSGALKNENTKKIAQGIRELGYVVNEVTPEQEGKYAAVALLNDNYKSNSYVVDIGSGNTKISWYENGQIKALEGAGAKYTQKGLSDKAVYDEITSLASRIPERNRDNAFIIGGVPFELANANKVDSRFQKLRTPSSYNFDEKDVKQRAGLNIYSAVKDATGTENFIFDWDANFTIGFLLGLK